MFEVINKILLESEKPSKELRKLIKEGKLNQKPFDKLVSLREIEQNKIYHPEGDVLEHVFLVVDEASKHKNLSKDKKAFMWGALLHDIGKLTTTKVRKGKITSYNHDIEGEKIALDFLNEISDDKAFNEKVSKFVRWHMQPLFFNINKKFFQKEEMEKEIDYKEIALLSLCDRLGRAEFSNEHKESEKKQIEEFIKYFENN